MNPKIFEKFNKGLIKLDLTFKEFEDDYFYAGGDGKNHLKTAIKNGIVPSQIRRETHCVCGHAIMEQCYIRSSKDPTKIIILGNKCIEVFGKSRQTCKKIIDVETGEQCREFHKTRNFDLCKKHKPTLKQLRQELMKRTKMKKIEDEAYMKRTKMKKIEDEAYKLKWKNINNRFNK